MQKRISFTKLLVCLMICLFSHFYCQSQTFNVTLSTDTIDCELTTIQAITGCNFNGSISLDIDGHNNGVEISNLSLVVDGQFNFDINASVISADPIQLTFTVITTDDPTGCSMVGSTSTSTIGLQCSCNGILSVEKIDETCFECNDGSASAFIEGLEEPVQYNWSDGQVSHSIIDLSPGMYFLTVTDGDGCEYIQDFEIIKYECSTTFSPETLIDEISCYETCDGSIEVNTTIPGLPSFTVEWEDNTTDPKRTDLCAGNYNATFRLADFCTYTETYTLDEPVPLQLETISVQHISSTHSTGIIHVLAQGGTAPINYNLYVDGQVHMDSDGIDSMFTELNIGCYEIEAIDANNCSVRIDSVCIEDLNTGLNNITILDFHTSPNPVHTLLNLDLPNLSIHADHRYKIINMKGEIVKSGVLHTQTLPLDELSQGVHTILIQHDKNLYRARFAKL